jgi:hypothetical protein
VLPRPLCLSLWLLPPLVVQHLVEPELVAKVPRKKKSVPISCRDETHDIDMKVMSDGVKKMNVDDEDASDVEEMEDEEESEIKKPLFKPHKAKSRVNKVA